MKLLFGFLVAYAFVTLVTAQNRTKRASGQRCLGLFDYYDSCEGSESREHHRRRPRKRPPPPPDSGECNPGCVRVPVYQGGCSPGCVLLRDCNSVSVQTSTTGCLRAADAKRIFDKFERLLEKQIIFEQKMSDFDYDDSCEGSGSREHHRRRPRKRPPPPPRNECQPPIYPGGCSPGCIKPGDCTTVSHLAAPSDCISGAEVNRLLDQLDRMWENQVRIETKFSGMSTCCVRPFTCPTVQVRPPTVQYIPPQAQVRPPHVQYIPSTGQVSPPTWQPPLNLNISQVQNPTISQVQNPTISQVQNPSIQQVQNSTIQQRAACQYCKIHRCCS